MDFLDHSQKSMVQPFKFGFGSHIFLDMWLRIQAAGIKANPSEYMGRKLVTWKISHDILFSFSLECWQTVNVVAKTDVSEGNRDSI